MGRYPRVYGWAVSGKILFPLPQHAWVGIPVAELAGADASSRMPLGWGAYVIDDWVAVTIFLYMQTRFIFGRDEGLPYFNNLVYRFVADEDEALSAVLAGECDLVDLPSGLETQTEALLQLHDDGQISLSHQTAFAWDVLEFDLGRLDPDRPAFFASREVRQAVAMCIDRQALVDRLSGGQMLVAEIAMCHQSTHSITPRRSNMASIQGQPQTC